MFNCLIRRLLLLSILSLSAQAESVADNSVNPVPDASVARAQFSTAILNREPVDHVVILSSRQKSVYFFTDIRGMQGRTVAHRWEYHGRVMSVVPFTVKGPRWRVYSKMLMSPDQTGEWMVTVVDMETGWPIHSELFLYDAPIPDVLSSALNSVDWPYSRYNLDKI